MQVSDSIDNDNSINMEILEQPESAELDNYFLPADFSRFWRLGRKRFRLWNAIYFLASRNPGGTFILYPYILKSAPFFLTYIRKESLRVLMQEIAEEDSRITFSPVDFGGKEALQVTVNLPDEGFSVPADFVKYALSKSRLLAPCPIALALLYIFSKMEGPPWDRPIFISNGDFQSFLKRNTHRRLIVTDVLETLTGRKALKYEKNLKDGIFTVRITWDLFRERNQVYSLKFRAGSLEEKTAECYNLICSYLCQDSRENKSDYLITAAAVASLSNLCSEFPEFADPETVIKNMIPTETLKSKYYLRRALADLLKDRKITCIWKDLSFDVIDLTKKKSDDPLVIPSNRYRRIIIIQYFYPGGQVAAGCRNLSCEVSASFNTDNIDDSLDIKISHKFALKPGAKIKNGYRDPLICSFPGISDSVSRVKILLNGNGNFMKLNVRVLVLLIP